MIWLLAAVWLGGCASVTRGWEEQMNFNSSPSEALMRTSTGMTCMTPCTLKVGRKDEFTASFSKPGYITEEIAVKAQLAGGGVAGLAGNVVLGGAIGASVDIVSGASLDHCPNPVSVTLRKQGSKEPPVDVAARCKTPEPTPDDKKDKA
jgi:hypothetical protein